MKNKLNETGSEFGNSVKSETKSGKAESFSKEQIEKLRAEWPDPEESRKLVLWLLELVNSKEEYEQLQKDLAELEVLTSIDSAELKGGQHNAVLKMEEIITIKGKRVIDIYESFDGSYWFITERCWEQDSIINGEVYKDDQILFGYAKLSACPEFAEWGYISETELKLLAPKVWKVPKKNWAFCPEIEVRIIDEKAEGA